MKETGRTYMAVALALAMCSANSYAAFAQSPSTDLLGPRKANDVNKPISVYQTGGIRASLWSGTGTISPDSVMVGGVTPGYGAQLAIRGAPYGPEDRGALLSMVMTNDSAMHSPAAIDGKIETGVHAMAGYGAFDVVGLYNQANNVGARFSLHNVTYTANRIIPSSRLKPEQIAQLREGMYVVTNSVDASVKQDGRVGYLPKFNLYSSTIASWAPDGSYIVVKGWTVPGSGHAGPGQVPGAVFDTFRSKYNNATAFVGAATKSFARNTILYYHPGSPDSQVREHEAEEIDMMDYATCDYCVSLHGITIGLQNYGIVTSPDKKEKHNTRPTLDSYDMKLAGAMPNMLLFDEAPTSIVIRGHSFFVTGNAGVGPKVGSQKTQLESDAYADGMNNMRLVFWQQREKTGLGAGVVSERFGLKVDGNQGEAGTPEGQMAFSSLGNEGGVKLLGGSGNGGLAVAYDGSLKLLAPVKSNLDVDGDVLSSGDIVTGPGKPLRTRAADGSIGGTINSDEKGDLILASQKRDAHIEMAMPVVFPAFRFESLPRPTAQGAQVFCANCRKPNETSGLGTGMMVFVDGKGRWASLAGTLAER